MRDVLRISSLTSPAAALAVAALFAGCGAEPAPVASADAASSRAGFGERCTADADCQAGLGCQTSEYSAFPWCTRACPADKAGDYCTEDGLGGRKGFCVQMPQGWRGPAAPFCAPLCAKLADCTGLDAGWEECSRPEYKEKVLYTTVQTKVCQTPSAHGQIIVDPVTCDWAGKITDPLLIPAKNECIAYCMFKKECQLLAKGESRPCCEWACFQRAAPSRVTDNAALAHVKCFTKSYFSVAGTPQVCTKYLEDCGPAE